MPNRMLRDWTASDKIKELTVYSERFFTRLIMKADDHGCYYADPKKLNAFLFPLLDTIRETDLLRWLDECHKAGLIALYEVEGKRYLQIVDFNQRLRQKIAKFPPPAECGQLSDITTAQEKRREVEEKGSEQPAHGLENSNLYRQPKIPTKNDVLLAISNAGGTVEMAKSFWEKHEGTGWFINGSPIVNYSALASKFVTNWKKNDKEKVIDSGPQPIYKNIT